MLLDPLGRADQALLLGVPAAEEDGALRLPAFFEQRTNAVDGFQHGGRSAVGIDCAVDPRVAVVADDYPVIRKIAALHLADDIPDRPALVILLRDEVHAHAAGSDVIAEGKSALPSLWHAGALQRFQDGRSIFVTERDGDDVRLVAVGID